MSGPPHHHQNRQPGTGNTAWNHLQVPNFFPARQPQHAHMSSGEHHMLHQPTWHTPTTTEAAPVVVKQPSHLFNLEQMLTERQFVGRLVQTPGVDLSLQRNGSSGGTAQNGDLPITPISLSVRDANKINSLPASALEVQPFELAKCVSPTQRGKSLSPGLKPNSPSTSPALDITTKNIKRPSKRVDSILERLAPEKLSENNTKLSESDSMVTPDNTIPSVIVQPTSVVSATSNDENSSPSPLQSGSLKEDDSASLGSNEDRSAGSNDDSLDGGKSRRKRKPAKTMRVNKEEGVVEIPVEIEVYMSKEETSEVDGRRNDEVESRLPAVEEEGNSIKEEIKERRRSNSVPPSNPSSPRKNRRKTSSESETVANIAAMIQEPESIESQSAKAVTVSVIKSKETLEETVNNNAASEVITEEKTPVQQHVIVTPAQKKIVTNTHFVEVENKLEEMFAGLEDDTSDPLKTDEGQKESTKTSEEELNQAQAEDVTSTSNDFSTNVMSEKRLKRGNSKTSSRRSSDCSSLEATPKSPRKTGKKRKTSSSPSNPKQSKIQRTKKTPKQPKTDQIKDVYAYDSGSNASSGKSKGPFIQIRGPRDSPLSVSVVNAPTNDEDGGEKRPGKGRKYHDDSEYRHKVRSKGLHCSTLSNKYDSQTRDATWICAFCKKGPHWCGGGGKGLGIVAGDLFGPYVITTKCQEYERRLDDPFDKQFKSKKVSRSIEARQPSMTHIKASKKWKRKHSESSLDSIPTCPQEQPQSWQDYLLGIADTGSGSYEVWAHEDCIVWSQGVYLIGARIIGLEEAVWTSCNVPCDRCKFKGANLCCVKRGCAATAHYGCAVEAGWELNEERFLVYCEEHRK